MVPMRPLAARRAQARRRGALEQELREAMDALRANDARFQQAADPSTVEQLIYEHAALLCRCNALLRELRGGAAPCPAL